MFRSIFMIRNDSYIIKISKLFNNKFYFYQNKKENVILMCMQIEKYFNRKVFQFSLFDFYNSLNSLCLLICCVIYLTRSIKKIY